MAGAAGNADGEPLPRGRAISGLPRCALRHPRAIESNAADTRNQRASGGPPAARHLRLPAATLRTWLVGRDYPKASTQVTFHPLIKQANEQPFQLSFFNLIEAHVLRALRTEHGVSLVKLRNAIGYGYSKR